jgi:rubrerythrin
MNGAETTFPRSMHEFMSRACALEAEAAERYAELAELMRAHHNNEVADLFGRLARIEGLHRDKILARMGWGAPPDPDAFRWRTPEGPETTDFADLHYLMTPWHALKLAEHNEMRAAEFFEQLAAQDGLPPDLLAAAAETAAEEREHVTLIRAWLARVPEPLPDWDQDTDPPNVAD